MIKNVKFLVGNLNYNLKPFQPFSNKTVNFLNDFSNELNLIKDIKNYPDIKALAFWCRYKNIIKLKKNLNIEKNKIGLGLIFHITPSNIPTNFVYSLIFGLLSGNSNIIKVPHEAFSLSGPHSLLTRLLYEFGIIGTFLWIQIFAKSISLLKSYMVNQKWFVLLIIMVALVSIAIVHKSSLIYLALGLILSTLNYYENKPTLRK